VPAKAPQPIAQSLQALVPVELQRKVSSRVDPVGGLLQAKQEAIVGGQRTQRGHD
jgi:hypothetical protein